MKLPRREYKVEEFVAVWCELCRGLEAGNRATSHLAIIDGLGDRPNAYFVLVTDAEKVTLSGPKSEFHAAALLTRNTTTKVTFKHLCVTTEMALPPAMRRVVFDRCQMGTLACGRTTLITWAGEFPQPVVTFWTSERAL